MTLDTLPGRCRAWCLSAWMTVLGRLTRWLPIRQPMLLVGPGSRRRLGQWVAGMQHRKLLLVTDPMLARLGLLQDLSEALRVGGAAFVVFDRVAPDAPLPVIEQGVRLAREQGCDALLAVGGGSALDTAKAMALALANPRRPLAAVISDPSRQRKHIIVDTRLVPRAAALDPALMTGLPPAVTAATGIDALTHAVEAYLGTCAAWPSRGPMGATSMPSPTSSGGTITPRTGGPMPSCCQRCCASIWVSARPPRRRLDPTTPGSGACCNAWPTWYGARAWGPPAMGCPSGRRPSSRGLRRWFGRLVCRPA